LDSVQEIDPIGSFGSNESGCPDEPLLLSGEREMFQSV
jgi:hypothetical protein